MNSADGTQKTGIKWNIIKKANKIRRINKMKKLRYEKYNGLDSMIIIDLHNGYSVIAANGWDKAEKIYKVCLFLKDNQADILNLIEEAKTIEIRSGYKTVNSAVLRHVSELLEARFFEPYIERTKYEQKCFDIGNMAIEETRYYSTINVEKTQKQDT